MVEVVNCGRGKSIFSFRDVLLYRSLLITLKISPLVWQFLKIFHRVRRFVQGNALAGLTGILQAAFLYRGIGFGAFVERLKMESTIS